MKRPVLTALFFWGCFFSPNGEKDGKTSNKVERKCFLTFLNLLFINL